MNPKRLYARISQGETSNVSFSDLVRLLHAFGFVDDGARASHQFFRHRSGIRMNLQSRRGEAKDYQIRQFLELVESQGLDWENSDES